MGQNTVPVGSGTNSLVSIGDGATLANVLSVDQAHTGDAQSFAALYSLLAKAVPFLLNAAGTDDRLRSAIGTTGILPVDSESTKLTYSGGIVGLLPAANATDFFTIFGSATKTVKVKRIAVSGFATAAASNTVQLMARSAVDTTGTHSAPTAVPHDRNDAAATATLLAYTVNPGGLGALVGLVRARQLNLGAPGAAGEIVWTFGDRNTKSGVLRGTGDGLCLNWNAAAVPAGTLLTVDIEWTEE